MHLHPPCGSPIRPIARPGPAQARLRGWKGKHPKGHLEQFAGTLQADAYAASIISVTAAGSAKPRVGRTQGVTYTKSTSCISSDHSRSYRAHGCAVRHREGDSLQPTGAVQSDQAGQSGTAAPQPAEVALKTRSRSPRRSPILQRQSAMRSRAGVPSRATQTRASSRSTTTPRNEPCVSSPSAQELTLRRLRRRRRTRSAMYSLLGSGKLNGSDPEIYLQHVLERIADHLISCIDGQSP